MNRVLELIWQNINETVTDHAIYKNNLQYVVVCPAC